VVEHTEDGLEEAGGQVSATGLRAHIWAAVVVSLVAFGMALGALSCAIIALRG